MPGSSSSYQVAEPPAFSSPMHYGGTLPSTGKAMEHDGGNINMLPDANKIVQVRNFHPLCFLPLSKTRASCSMVTTCQISPGPFVVHNI